MLSKNNSLSNKKESELDPETTSENNQDQKQNLLNPISPEEIKKEEEQK